MWDLIVKYIVRGALKKVQKKMKAALAKRNDLSDEMKAAVQEEIGEYFVDIAKNFSNMKSMDTYINGIVADVPTNIIESKSI